MSCLIIKILLNYYRPVDLQVANDVTTEPKVKGQGKKKKTRLSPRDDNGVDPEKENSIFKILNLILIS